MTTILDFVIHLNQYKIHIYIFSAGLGRSLLLKYCLPAVASIFLFLICIWEVELNLLLESVMKVCQHFCRVIQETISECILNGLKCVDEYEASLFSNVHNER